MPNLTQRFLSTCCLILALPAMLLGEPESPEDLPHRAAEPAPLPEVVIAVVRDGNSWYIDEQLVQIQQSLEQLTSTKVTVSFKEDPDFSANWSPSRAAEALRAALIDPEVDYLLLQGFLVMDAAARAEYVLPKPVVGGFLQEPEVIDYLLDEEQHSVVPNLNIVVSNHSIREDLQRFKTLVDFDRIYVLAAEPYLENLGFLRDYIVELEQSADTETHFIGMGDKAQPVLDQLPQDASAVYVFPPVLMDEAERTQLIDGINTRGIPSFSYIGEPAVREGILGGSLPDIRQQLARRTALNFQRIIFGESPNEVPTVIYTEPHLYLNARTADQIGYDISFETASYAEVLFAQKASKGDPINLPKAIEMALTYNFQYLAQRQSTKISFEDERLAMSPLLPQIYGFVGYNQIDTGTVRASGGSQSNNSAEAGVRISQIIFSDERISNLRVAGENYEAATLEEEVVRLNIIQLTAVSYIQYLSAVSLEKIARDNLAVTRRNLELSRIRERVGTGGLEEVYRFEASEASDRASVADAQAAVEIALVTLNQVLGEDLNRRWAPEDLNLDSSYFEGTVKTASDLISTDARYERFRLFSLQYGVSRSPEVEALDRTIQGQEISLGQKERAFYMPDIGANFEYANTFHRSSDYNPVLWPDDSAWFVSVNAEIPIFEGGERIFDVMRQQAVVRNLQYTRDYTRQLVQQRILNSLYQLSASYSNINYSEIAADRANKNLNIVTEKYQQGTVNNIDLIDAQNEAFRQRQNEVLATYGFLQDLVNYMRSINYYEFYADPSQRDAWVQQAEAFANRESTTVSPR